MALGLTRKILFLGSRALVISNPPAEAQAQGLSEANSYGNKSTLCLFHVFLFPKDNTLTFQLFSTSFQCQFYKFLQHYNCLCSTDSCCQWVLIQMIDRNTTNSSADTRLTRRRIRLMDSGRQKVTTADLSALRLTISQVPIRVPASVAFVALWGWLARTVCGRLSSNRRQDVCRVYGHAIDARLWNRMYPHCRDCGKTIRSRHELRSSLARN